MQTYFEKYGHTLITLAAIIAAFIGLVAINGNRFDGQDRRFDTQDKFNNQLFELVNQRLDAQDKIVTQHFEAINQRLDAQEKNLDRLTDEVSELRKLTVGISERVSRSEGEIDVIRQQLRIADTPSP